MPTYDYRCQDCGHNFEAFQSIKDKPLKKCPLCQGSVKRMISAGAGLIFKGSGFYITDYKKKEEKKSKSENKKEEKSQEKDTSSKKKDGENKKDTSKT